MLYKLPTGMPAAPSEEEGAIGSVPVRTEERLTAELPLYRKNLLVTGTTGSGKTVFTKKFAHACRAYLPDLLQVYNQIKPNDFTSEFFEAGSRIVAFSPASPHPEAHFHWGMIRELRESSDLEAELRRLGNSLISDLLQDPHSRPWAEPARDTFTGFLRVIIQNAKENPSNAAVIRWLRSMATEELLRYLSQDPANHSLLRKTYQFDPCDPPASYKPPRTATDTLFFLQYILSLFLNSNFASETGTDTVSDFLHGRLGRSLFIQHDLAHADAFRPFELYILRKLIEDKMSPSAGVSRPLLLVLDEADKINGDFGALTAATLGRGYGLITAISTQSIENLYALCPKDNREHTGAALLSGFPVVAAFHQGDPESVTALQTLFGEDYQTEFSPAASRCSAPEFKTELRPLVSARAFAELGVGECYIKQFDRPPRRVKILLEDERGQTPCP